MGLTVLEYNFKAAVKPCDDLKRCIKNAKNECPWYSMCDLSMKIPWEKPTQPQEFRRPKRQPRAIVYIPGSKFYEKQREIARRKQVR